MKRLDVIMTGKSFRVPDVHCHQLVVVPDLKTLMVSFHVCPFNIELLVGHFP